MLHAKSTARLSDDSVVRGYLSRCLPFCDQENPVDTKPELPLFDMAILELLPIPKIKEVCVGNGITQRKRGEGDLVYIGVVHV